MNNKTKNNSGEKRTIKIDKGQRNTLNEKRGIGTHPDTTLTSKPNTTKPNKSKG